jgi:hypothetical protein
MKANGEVKPGRIVKTKESIKHFLSDTETLELSRESAKTHQELEALQNEKDRVMSDLKAQIQAKENTISDYNRRINNGYEHRYLDCELRYHVPSKGMKTLFRMDTGAEVRSTKMDTFELQDVLFEQPDPDKPDWVDHPHGPKKEKRPRV